MYHINQVLLNTVAEFGTFQVIAVLLIPVLWTLYSFLTCQTRHLPGPFYSKFTAWPLSWNAIRGERSKFVQTLHEKYGPIVRVAPKVVSLNSEEAIKKIYDNSHKYLKDPVYWAGLLPMLGGIVDPHYATHLRALMSPIFTRANILTTKEFFEKGLNRGQKVIDQDSEKGTKSIEMLRIARWMMLDIVGDIVLGTTFKALEKQDTQLLRDLELYNRGAVALYAIPWLKTILGSIPGTTLHKAKGAGKRMITMAYSFLQLGISQASSDSTKKDAVSQISKSKAFKERTKEQQAEDLTIVSFTMLFGGIDTVSNSIAYFIFEMARNPKMLFRLRKEIEEIWQDGSIFPDLLTLEQLPYLSACVKETLRLYNPLAPHVLKLIPAEGLVVDGYYIPGGISAGVQAYSLHRTKEVWGEDVEVFRPERWFNETPEMKTFFFTFSKGRRACSGEMLAWAGMRFILAFLAKNYHIQPADGLEKLEEEMKSEEYFFIAPKHHVCNVWMVPIESSA